MSRSLLDQRRQQQILWGRRRWTGSNHNDSPMELGGAVAVLVEVQHHQLMDQTMVVAWIRWERRLREAT